jgi:predicted permease
VGTIGVALGITSAIFAVVQKVLIEPLPYEDADRLVYIAASAPGFDFPDEFGVSLEFYFEYRELTDVLEDVGTFNSFTNTLRIGDRVERVRMSIPTPSMFTTLGVQPMIGRLPVAEDEQDVMLISHAAWQDWFGADPSVIGRGFEVAGGTRTVIGVMGPDFAFPNEGVLVWIPNNVRNEGLNPGRFGVSLVGRVPEGVELEAVRARLRDASRVFPEKYGGSARYLRLMELHEPIVRPLEDELFGFVKAPLWVLLGSMTVVLLIACANVTNLFLVRSERNLRDLAVRRAIGAGSAQLARLQLSESVVIAGMAGVLAVGLAWVTLPALVSSAPGQVPRLSEAVLTPSTLAFTLLLCLIVAFVCGLPPAMRAAGARTSALREGARGTTRRRHRGRDALVTLQTALALTLLVGSGLLLRSFQALQAVDPGYDVEDVFTFQMAIEDEPGLEDAVSLARFHLDFLDRLRALPGVASAGIVENVPLNEGVGVGPFQTEATMDDEGAAPTLGRTWAAGDYFEVMNIGLLRGRTFEDAEQLDNPGSVIVSERAAELLWPGEDPIGKRLYWSLFESWETVVGVVEDVMQYDFRDEVQPMVYFPLVAQDPEDWAFSSPGYVLKTGRADEIGPEVRALVREVAPSAPMYRVFTMEGLAADTMIEVTFTMMALGVASAMALLLGAVGLYGVLSYVVAERTREIGVRMALGARAEGVRRMVVLQGVRVVSVGVVVGLAVAAGASRALGSLLYDVSSADPLTYALVGATMLCVGTVASYLPARRASNLDPVESLRAG